MNKLYILDFLISCVLAGINIKYTKITDYKILVSIIWSIFIISSIFLNNSLTVYFISSIIIGFSILAIYIMLKIPIKKNISIIFWVLYFISALIITSIIASKKMFFANVYNEPLMGSKGEDGSIGNKGESYYLKTYPEKCYNDLVLAVEDYLIQNMKINDINYDSYKYQLKNLYFKQLLKRISSSQEFNNYVFFGTKYTENHDDTLLSNEFTENNYNKIIEELKKIVIKWCKYILFNNINEDDNLKEKLGYDVTSDISQLIPKTLNFSKNKVHEIVDNNLREDMRYNNKTGRKFFDDYFLTPKYFEEHLIIKNNIRKIDNKQVKYNPFTYIATEELVLSSDSDSGSTSNNLDTPFNWGKSNDSENCNK